jgi:hypothetical protein
LARGGLRYPSFYPSFEWRLSGRRPPAAQWVLLSVNRGGPQCETSRGPGRYGGMQLEARSWDDLSHKRASGIREPCCVDVLLGGGTMREGGLVLTPHPWSWWSSGLHSSPMVLVVCPCHLGNSKVPSGPLGDEVDDPRPYTATGTAGGSLPQDRSLLICERFQWLKRVDAGLDPEHRET